MIKKSSTWVLRGAVIGMGLVVLVLCIFALPQMWKGGSAEFPQASQAFLFIIIAMYLTTLPFFFAVWQTLKLLKFIDQNMAFSDKSVKALRNIKRCAIVIGVLYLACVPLLLPIAEADDAPGIVLFGFVAACTPLIIAIFAAVLERLLRDAIKIKSENELTV